FYGGRCPTKRKPIKPMSNFTYEAVDSGGLNVKGKLEVVDQNEAIRRVKEMGLFPVRIVELRSTKGRGSREEGKRRGIWRASGRKRDSSPDTRHRTLQPRGRGLSLEIQIPFISGRVKPAVLAVFTRQLATLVEAGMPLLRGLRLLREQEEDSPALRRVLDEISDGIEDGGSLSEALAAHPKIFNTLYVNMVKAGELSGALEVTLRRLADFMEKAQKIKGKVKAAMFYPAAVLVVATAILILMMVYIIPKFRELFDGMNMKMPAFTVFVLKLSLALKTHLPLMGAGAVALVVAFLLAIRTKAGRRVWDQFRLKAPVFGPIFRKLAISRFARTLGTLIANGVPILQALNIVKETTGNVVVSGVVRS